MTINDDLFAEELVDLRREVMTRGVLIPIAILGYLGLVVSYQKVFLLTLDMRIPIAFAMAFLVAVGCLFINSKTPNLAIRLTSVGIMFVAAALYMTGLDGGSAIALSLACGVVSFLMGIRWGILAVIVAILVTIANNILFTSNSSWLAEAAQVFAASAFTINLSAAISNVLFRTLRWTEENYQLARKHAKDLEDKSAQLELALKSLGQTSFQLARANEQMEVAMQYAEEARQTKQQYAAAVSHELRAPLNLIIGFSDLILYEPGTYQRDLINLPPRLMADVKVINNHAQHLLKLVNDILDLSQLDVTYLTVSRTPSDIEAIIRSALTDYSLLTEQRNLYLRIEVQPNLPQVLVDPTRIRQVLLNLLSNAIKVTESGGIQIKVRQMSTVMQTRIAGYEKHDGGIEPIVISVTDTGIGIPGENLGRIFEPFVQVHDELREGKGGSGLGLTISKRFVELHGGQMWVESIIGEGSTFYFSLPVAATQAESIPERTLRGVNRHELGTLVVVEKNTVLSRLVERQIDGIRVQSISTLDELSNADAPTPEIILINEPQIQHVDMPILRGKALNTPILRCFVHGALSPELVDTSGGHVPRHHYLIKPIQREDLYSVMAQLLASTRSQIVRSDRAAKVMVVEDEDDAAFLLNRLLKIAPEKACATFRGINVLRARTGEQAMDILRESTQVGAEPIDAVLLDLALGGMSGYDVLIEMDRHQELREIPICVITGQVAGGDRLVTPYLSFTRSSGLSTRELTQAIVALTRIAVPGADVTVK